jgi:D-alanyl-D-alanine carboxypeptidase/D-alanyl-D-alanine-endopeptidase (penicillin-binding protein 4)
VRAAPILAARCFVRHYKGTVEIGVSGISRRWQRAAAALLWVLVATAVWPAARRERADVRRFRSRAEALLQGTGSSADWGVLIADRDTGEILYEHNADRYFTPASNAKLFTTALALATLGPEYRFRTTLEGTGPLDARGTLQGDLVLVGRGDPNLSNRVFPVGEHPETQGPPEQVLDRLVEAAVAGGLRQVAGDVVADDSFFTPERYPPGWTVDDLTAGYGAAVSALVVADNTLEVEVVPANSVGAPVGFAVRPWADFYRFHSYATTAPAGTSNSLQLHREPGSRDVALTGTLALNAPPVKLELGVDQPAEFAAALLRRLLQERGVVIYGGTRARHAFEPAPPASVVLAAYTSPPLAQAVAYLNKVSQNLHAECLLRTVARERTGEGSREKGLEQLQRFLAAAGIATGVHLVDGSGLSVYDQVTPRAVVQLLRYADGQSWGPAFEASLPVAGRDGTLEKRMVDTVAAGRLQAKTGTLAHVATLSGYATTLAGERLVFSILVNGTPPEQRMTGLIDELATAMVAEIGVPPRRSGREAR